MAKITQAIQPRTYEYIGLRICEILLEELSNQVLLTYDEDICTNIFHERIVAPNEGEFPLINVMMSSFEGDGNRVTNGFINITYFIDIYYVSFDSTGTNSDELAITKMKRTAGMIEAILKNPAYRTLDYAPGVIGRTTITRMNVMDNTKQDSYNTAMGRITFEVMAQDNYELKEAIDFTKFTTTMMVGDTNNGQITELI